MSMNGIAGKGTTNKDWWPKNLNVNVLRLHSHKSDPMGTDFKYHEEFLKLDLAAVKADISDTMRDSKFWWPADYGHYGPFFRQAHTEKAMVAVEVEQVTSVWHR